MTPERFDYIRREFEQAIRCQAAFGGVDSPLLLWGETIKALEEAWVERDAAIEQRDERALRAAGLIDQVKDLCSERDQLKQRVQELEAQHSKEIIARYPY